MSGEYDGFIWLVLCLVFEVDWLLMFDVLGFCLMFDLIWVYDLIIVFDCILCSCVVVLMVFGDG